MPAARPLSLALLAALAAALALSTARAEGTALPPGPVARLDLAARLYARGLARADAVTVLAAVHLARGVALRPGADWAHQTQPAGAPAPAAPPPATPPAAVLGDEARAAAFLLAEGDESLTDLAETLLAEPARRRTGGANSAASTLPPGSAEVWDIPLPGQERAEIGVFAQGAGLFGWQVSDAAGTPLCTAPPGPGPLYCSFTPPENGWYRVTVMAETAAPADYLLITD